ncbi:proteobacterial dedicated sortase system histidine kinase [Gilvimarinus sp. F26214L]|uniref:proteobacterial dedicated sortase system histidine kinase n=1 Tax=Gilvimarinus sp. DZF01 TaxID=3461371 RepID=UPI004046259D
MNLRRQLLVVSLFLLSLPWAGCQYVQQMEKALRDGQAKALQATARAVAARMESEAALITAPEHPAVFGWAQQSYLHPLRSAAAVDGYDAEWESLGVEPRTFTGPRNPDFSLRTYSGWYGEDIYLFFRVMDPSHDHHNPQQPAMASGDHLVLRTFPGDYVAREFVFRSGGNGTVTARYLNETGHIRQEHRIRGEWRETTEGYQIELRVPLRLAAEGFDYYFVDASAEDEQDERLGNSNPMEYPAPWVRPSETLALILAAYAEEGSRISVIDERQWLLARAGSLTGTDEGSSGRAANPLMAWLYRAAIGPGEFPVLPDARASGRMRTAEITRALRGDTGLAWYQNGRQRVGRVAVPIHSEERVIGAVTVEQSTDSLLAETNAAFGNLFFYTFMATGITGFGLLAYASWLSFRIRRLKRAADSAVGDDGHIHPELLRSKAGDEIGDLTRSYGRLLGRLRDYTDYLRTLSSKLSHELRTPLAVMSSSLENLNHEDLEPGARTYVQRARDASQRLAGILNAMSSASRMEESIQQAQREPFPLDELLRELINAYRGSYPNAQLDLEIAASEQGYSLLGAPDLIVQMLDKLVDNAVDFCPPDGRITVSLGRERNKVQLSVSNTGPPLPDHMQDQLFDSLVSVRKATQRGDGGNHLGLGLYIVRLIAEFHGGTVSARNLTDHRGVCFTVTLPA